MDILNLRNMLGRGKTIYDLPLRVTYYARVSTELEEQLNSLDSQVMYFENLIKKEQNWNYVEGYIDEGITGASVKKRDSFKRMIRDAKLGKFDLILTKEVSRFARNTLDSITYTQELLKNGVFVFFQSDNICTLDPDSELRLTLMSSLAQEEIRKLSERVKFGYKRSVEKGVVAGSNNIYGYRKNKGKLEIDPEQAEIVKTIFEKYVYEGIGTTKLSFDLYENYGFTNSKGNPIHAANIRDIIRNPKYKGYYCANKIVSLDYKTKQRKELPKTEWVMYEDHEKCPPIVSEELWNEANKILEARGNKHSNTDKSVYVQRFPLSSKIYCAHDNCCYTRGNWKTKNGKRVFWGCTSYRKNGIQKSDGCRSPLLYESELVQAFKPIIKDIIKNSDEVVEDIKSYLNEASLNDDYNKKLDICNRKLSEIKKQKDNLLEMRSSGEISSVEFIDFKEKLNIKMNTIQNEIDKIIGLKENVDITLSSIDELKNNILKITDINDDSVLSIASSLFEKIIVETNRDKDNNKKAILHCQLKLKGLERHDLSLSQLSLLKKSDKRFCRTKW